MPSPLPSIALSDDPPTYDNRGVLLGAAYFNGNYFISIQSKGVFCANTPTSLGSTAIAGSKDAGNFTGFIVIPDGSSNVLIMVSTTGTFCKITGTSPAIDDTNKWAYSFGFNGAIALYTKDSNQYLLFGLSGSSYGYLELEVPSLLAFTADTKPQGPTISVKDVNTYNASLGTHPVTSLYQAPNTIDSTMPIFASTSLDGLWSCRDGEWNLEE
ncbi:hypothetical protein AGMMS49991_00800 [Spirochaetia bacterium]|nr:hypothetical protein AGMMS49991_00800 [Spirochaetia bacterium]